MKTNKKIFTVLLAVMMLLSALALASCGGEGESADGTGSTDTKGADVADATVDISTGYEAVLVLLEKIGSGYVTRENIESLAPRAVWDAQGEDIDATVEMIQEQMSLSLSGLPAGAMIYNIDEIDSEKLDSAVLEELTEAVNFYYDTNLVITNGYKVKTETYITFDDSKLTEAQSAIFKSLDFGEKIEAEGFIVEINGKWYSVSDNGRFDAAPNLF